jgi:hypothetical protein
MEKKDFPEQWTPERIQRLVRENMLREEAERVADRKQVRKARQRAAERFREANAERRARAHRLIRLGAEVEASGLADLLGHDVEAIFGILTAVVEQTSGNLTADAMSQFVELGRTRRKKVAEAPSPTPEQSTQSRGRKKRTLPGGRIAIRFPSPPPEAVRRLLRAMDYRWRLGLRSWVGERMPEETALKLVRDFGGEILLGPDAPE